MKEINNAYIQKSPKPDFYIYLNTDIETCLYRIRSRKAPGEGGVDYEYLNKIDNLHRSWMKQIDQDKKIEISYLKKTLTLWLTELKLTFYTKTHRFQPPIEKSHVYTYLAYISSTIKQ